MDGFFGGGGAGDAAGAVVICERVHFGQLGIAEGNRNEAVVFVVAIGRGFSGLVDGHESVISVAIRIVGVEGIGGVAGPAEHLVEGRGRFIGNGFGERTAVVFSPGGAVACWVPIELGAHRIPERRGRRQRRGWFFRWGWCGRCGGYGSHMQTRLTFFVGRHSHVLGGVDGRLGSIVSFFRAAPTLCNPGDSKIHRLPPSLILRFIF